MSQKAPPQARRQASAAVQIPLRSLGGTRVQAVFDEPDLSSDGGVLLLREAAQVNGIVEAMAAVLPDSRSQAHVKHTQEELMMQRTLQICQGYEDANDCDTMREDSALKVAVGRHPDGNALASQPTMSRLENSVGLRELIRLFYVQLDAFLDSYASAPQCMILDMDPTPNRVYGDQQLALFNGHYDEYCLMPFHVYEGLTGRVIATIVRPGKTPTDGEILALLKRIVRRIRSRFPDTVLIFRADSHHTKPAVLDWLEQHDVHYVLGMAVNAVLKREVESLVGRVASIQHEQWSRCRRFHSFSYAAGTWSRKRRIVARVEATAMGTDTRFVVTDLDAVGARQLYEVLYCDRANAELMIKEHKCFLKSSRTSCTSAYANQFRLFLHSAAYAIMHALRETVLRETEWATATFETIRLRLLKVAARVETGKTFVRFHMPSGSAASTVFVRVAELSAALTGT